MFSCCAGIFFLNCLQASLFDSVTNGNKEDGTDSSEINRHAILHGSINSFGTRFNVIKLITFLYLMLELEPVFKILFDES